MANFYQRGLYLPRLSTCRRPRLLTPARWRQTFDLRVGKGQEEHWVRSTRGVSRCAVWVAGPSLDLVGKDISHLCFLGPAVQRPCSIWKLAPCRVCLFLFYDVEPGNTSRAHVLGRCTVARLLSWFWMKTLSTRGDTPLSSAWLPVNLSPRRAGYLAETATVVQPMISSVYWSQTQKVIGVDIGFHLC